MCASHCEPFTSIFQLLLMAQGKKSAADHYAKGIICVYIKAHLRLTGWTSDPTSGGTNIHTQTKRSLSGKHSWATARAGKKIACRQRFVRHNYKTQCAIIKAAWIYIFGGGTGVRCNIMTSSLPRCGCLPSMTFRDCTTVSDVLIYAARFIDINWAFIITNGLWKSPWDCGGGGFALRVACARVPPALSGWANKPSNYTVNLIVLYWAVRVLELDWSDSVRLTCTMTAQADSVGLVNT
jgi:hypothetical protein